MTAAAVVENPEPLEEAGPTAVDAEGDGERVVPKSSEAGGPTNALRAPGEHENVVGTTPIRDVDRDANVEEKEDKGDAAVEPPAHPCAEKMFDTRVDDAEAFAPAPPEADRSADTLEKATRTTMETPLSRALAGVAVDWSMRALPPPEFAASVGEKYSTLPVAGHSADDSDTVEREVPAAAARPRRRSAASVDDVKSDGPHHGKVIESDAAGGGVVGVALGRK